MVLEDWIRSKYVRKEFLKRPGASNDRVDPGTHPALPSPLPDSPHFSFSFTVHRIVLRDLRPGCEINS